MEHETLAHAAAVAGAVGAAALLLARGRLLVLGSLAVVAAAEAGLAYALVPDAPGLIVHSTLRIGAVAVGGLAVVALAAVFVRFPGVAPVALLVAAPFRLSVGLGSQQAFLLLPLYAVLSAAALALAYRALVDREPAPAPLLVAGPIAALVALAGLSFLWTRDLRAGAIELLFFYFPFTVLFAVVARSARDGWRWKALAAALVSVTGLFAAIGVFQAWSHTEILAKQDVQLANAYASFFRVTSLFQDPSVYGRHLVLGMVVLFALLWLARVGAAVALPLLALLGAGLYFSYSQTSLLSLFAAVLVVTLVASDRFTRRVVLGAAAVLAVVAAALVLVVSGGDSASRVTSDRSQLAKVTLPVYTAHPVVGVGIGSQPLMSRREAEAHKRKSKNVSHTTPLTIAAELGTLGLLFYAVFLAAMGRALLATWRRHRPLGLVLAGCLTALVVHSLSYGGFFEDPFVWGIAALAAAALTFLPHRARAAAAQAPG